jgi:hypothetical protein
MFPEERRDGFCRSRGHRHAGVIDLADAVPYRGRLV